MLQFLPKNEKPSFEDFYESNYNRVLYHVKGKITNHEDAEDLTSAIFTYCYAHYEDYDPEKSSITTWLYLIVNSRIKNYYRDHDAVAFADYEVVSETMQDHSVDLDEGVYMEQLHGALMKAIGRLPERQKQIVMMSYFQNLTSDQIAKKLGLTSGNVRVLLSRALDKLAKDNERLWEEFTNHG